MIYLIHANHELDDLQTHNFKFLQLPKLATNSETYDLDQTFAIGVIIYFGTYIIYKSYETLCFLYFNMSYIRLYWSSSRSPAKDEHE